ncbi:MAG: hypothetical protein ACXAB9_12460 [Candidatus Thorarchaeota archaeon]
MTEQTIDTIFDRPRGLRFIGLTQMLFGVFGLLATIGLIVAEYFTDANLGDLGLTYALAIFFGIALPGLVIGNFVDDLRRGAVIAQIAYSILAVILTGFFLFMFGLDYSWTFPLFDTSFDVLIGNLAAGILAIQLVFALYLVARWNVVAPPPGTKIERDRGRAGLIERGLFPSPLSPSMLAADGQSHLSDKEAERILKVRKLTTDEGMAILCSNCGGATPLTKIEDDNTVPCEFCGVKLAVSSVFLPCEHHPEYLAATTCAVCGDHFCRRCLTAQKPPVDERWEGSTVYLCQRCFEGRYQPAVTTTSLVIPIDELFGQAGSRFSKVGGIYRRFLGKYAGIMKYVFRIALEIAASMGKSGSRGGGKGGDDAASFLVVIILIIIAIPVLVGVLLLAGAIVIVPILFYAGLVGVTIEAVKIIRRTDFVSLDRAREKGLLEGKPPRPQESILREQSRSWEYQGPKNNAQRHATSDRFYRKEG